MMWVTRIFLSLLLMSMIGCADNKNPVDQPTPPPTNNTPNTPGDVNSPNDPNPPQWPGDNSAGFVLALGQSKLVYNQGRRYTLKIIEIEMNPPQIQCFAYPCVQPEPYVVLEVKIHGGCGTYSSPNCMGVPDTWQELTFTYTDNTQWVQSLEIQLAVLRSNWARFLISQ